MVTRVGMLAPMQHELQPLVRRLALETDGSWHRGRTGNVEVLAVLTNIGMAAGAAAAQRVVDEGVDHVVVVGIAGGVDRSVQIGDVVVPSTVIDRATGDSYEPSLIGDRSQHGKLSCGDELILDPPTLAEMAADGVVAVDMETAAVAAVCERSGCPWSVFRAISDYAGEGLVDAALFELTRPDGTADADALARYLEADPTRAGVLARLADDMNRATESAAAAAISACTTL